jgi:hypothetical protein
MPDAKSRVLRITWPHRFRRRWKTDKVSSFLDGGRSLIVSGHAASSAVLDLAVSALSGKPWLEIGPRLFDSPPESALLVMDDGLDFPNHDDQAQRIHRYRERLLHVAAPRGAMAAVSRIKVVLTCPWVDWISDGTPNRVTPLRDNNDRWASVTASGRCIVVVPDLRISMPLSGASGDEVDDAATILNGLARWDATSQFHFIGGWNTPIADMAEPCAAALRSHPVVELTEVRHGYAAHYTVDGIGCDGQRLLHHWDAISPLFSRDKEERIRAQVIVRINDAAGPDDIVIEAHHDGFWDVFATASQVGWIVTPDSQWVSCDHAIHDDARAVLLEQLRAAEQRGQSVTWRMR